MIINNIIIFPNSLWNSINKTVVQIQEIHIVIEKQGERRTYIEETMKYLPPERWREIRSR